MHHFRHYRVAPPLPQKSPEVALQDMATEILGDPAQLARYNQVLWHWVGHPVVEARLRGQHPWPEYYSAAGQRRLGSVPVLASFSPESHSLLVVKKDNWQHQNDVSAWHIRRAALRTGKVTELLVLSSSVEQATNRVWLQVTNPETRYGQPPPCREGNHPLLRRDQTRIEARLTSNYYASTAELHHGLRHAETFTDIEILHGALQQLVQNGGNAIRAVPDLEVTPMPASLIPPAVA